MQKSDYDGYERRSRLYHSAFEEYDSLKTTYLKFYSASDAFNKRGRILTYGSTLFGAILLFIIGAVLVRDQPAWGNDVAFAASVVVATLSFFNAVDSPQRASNVTYNSGQQLQRVYMDFHQFVTIQLPDPDEELEELEEEFDRLIEMKNTVNETTPKLGDKWYYRAKEKRSSWEPKPLTEVTGKDGEFSIDKEESRKRSVSDRLSYSVRKIIRWFGF